MTIRPTGEPGSFPTDPGEGVVASDDRLTAKYRRLQASYREHVLGVAEWGEGVGGRLIPSMLPEAAQSGLNFLNGHASAHAEERITEVPKERGSLAPDRLRRNMLSSMPLCFNIFGALRDAPGFPRMLEAAFDIHIDIVERVVCEWVPPRAGTDDRDLLGDRSAFDAAVLYAAPDGRRCLLGIETKYTEPFSQVVYDKPSYRSVHDACGWFTADCDSLLTRPTNQLFRTVLLAAAAEASAGFDEVRVGVLTLAEDKKAETVVSTVRSSLRDPTKVVHVSHERLRDIAASSEDPAVAEWALQFGLRYLDSDQLSGDPGA